MINLEFETKEEKELYVKKNKQMLEAYVKRNIHWTIMQWLGRVMYAVMIIIAIVMFNKIKPLYPVLVAISGSAMSYVAAFMKRKSIRAITQEFAEMPDAIIKFVEPGTPYSMEFRRLVNYIIYVGFVTKKAMQRFEDIQEKFCKVLEDR